MTAPLGALLNVPVRAPLVVTSVAVSPGVSATQPAAEF